MADTYTTISGPAQAVFTEKRSKFLAFAFPVTTVAEARTHIDALAREYYDARHVCWAYMLGYKRENFRANDNGEPSGTAGRPILGQINSRGFTDVLVVVVRYFGGIKLGTPGLIAAYREASRLALEQATPEERHVTERITFTYPYMVINDVMKLSRTDGVKVLAHEMDNACTMTLEVNLDAVAEVTRRLGDIDGVTIASEPTDNDDE